MQELIQSAISTSPNTRRLLKPLTRPSRLRLSVDENLRYFFLYPAIRHTFPEWKFVDNALRVPATDTSALIIASSWPADMIDADEDALTLLQHRVLSFASMTSRVVLQAKCLDGTPPSATFLSRPGVEYMPHQVYAAQCAIGSPGYALFMEQGTGKTLVAIIKICEESLLKTPYRALIACPRAVRTNWREEIERFAYVDATVTTLDGGELNRTKALIDALRAKTQASVVIASYDVMWRMASVLKTVTWDLVVLDEAHMIKSDKAKRTRGALALRDSARSRLVLTGTPIVNSPADLHSPLEFLEEGASGFSSHRAFKEFYCKYTEISETHKIYTGAQNVPLLQERLSRYSFRVMKAQVLRDLPPKVYDVIDVDMTPEQRKLYETVANSIRVEIEGMDMDNAVTVNHVLTRLLRLAQITSGFVPLDEEEAVHIVNPNPKLEALVEMLKEKPPTSKTIVWACWVTDIRVIAERLAAEGIEAVEYYGAVSADDRDEAVRRFNSGTARVFVGNPDCGGVGINLLGQSDGDTNCDHMIYFSQRWSAAVRSQSEDRAHRRGTRTSIRITDLSVPRSIDEEIRKRVLKKRIEAHRVQDVREVLERALQCLE